MASPDGALAETIDTQLDASTESPADAGITIGRSQRANRGPSQAHFEYDFNENTFDPIAYIPNARRYAQKFQPDVQLTGLRFGRIDGGQFSINDTSYSFLSPGTSTAKTCTKVTVSFTPGTVDVARVDGQPCNEPKIATPRCTVTQIWNRAKPADREIVTIDARGWVFGAHVFPDECSADTQAAAAGQVTGKTRTEFPRDYNSALFDPVAYIPKAIEHAHAVEPSVDLVSIYFYHAQRDGYVDVAATSFAFTTTTPGAKICPWVTVFFQHDKVIVGRIDDNRCTARKIGAPRCKVSQILERAHASKDPVDIVLSSAGWATRTDKFEDDCK
jgi:hypothetical protein